MSNITEISKLSDDYILKNVFSYLNYRTALKIIKYNKTLQKRIGITIKNYKKEENFPKYQYIKQSKIVAEHEHYYGDIDHFFLLYIVLILLMIIIFIYDLIYSILLVCLKTFDDDNTKNNYDKTLTNNINIINACLFILDAQFVEYCILFIFFYDQAVKEHGKKK